MSEARLPEGALSSETLNEQPGEAGYLSPQPPDKTANYALERHRQRLAQRKWIFWLAVVVCIVLYSCFVLFLVFINWFDTALNAAPLLALTFGLFGVLPTLVLCSLIKGIYSVQMDALEQKKDEPDIESLAGKVAQNMLLRNFSAMK